MALMVSVSGIRGIIGSDLNPENLARFAAAYGTWLQGGTVVLGRDSRTTGALCEDVVTAALRSVGCPVIKVGIVPTPTVAMSVLRHNASGGIVISASHNPAEWNALKLLNGKSEFLDAGQGNQVLEIAKTGTIDYKPWNEHGSVVFDNDALDAHIQSIFDLPYIRPDVIKRAGFSVAVDAVNGAGSLALPKLLERFEVETIHKLHCTPNGLFPHNPEPLPEHLQEICELVPKAHASLGFVTDPDADRLAVVDETGKLWGEEYTQAAAFDFILDKNPGSCATNLSSSRVVDEVAARYGQKCVRSAVGEINVVKAMQSHNSVIGGEGNGGVICPDLHYGRDALVGVAIVLQMLAERDISASEYRKSLPDFFMEKTKISLTDLGTDAGEVLSAVEKAFTEFNPVTVDGIKIDFPEGWVHLRKSNTEPIVRVYSEGTTREMAKELANRVKAVM